MSLMQVAEHRRAIRFLTFLMLAAVAGCSLFDRTKERDPFAEDDGTEKRGELGLEQAEAAVKRMIGLGPNRALAQQHFGEAKSLYQQAERLRETDSAASREAFAEAAEEFSAAAERWPKSALEEEALFLAGESRFFEGDYPDAEDAFAELLKEYPRTQYLDRVQARRFAIAQYWLQLHEADPDAFYEFNLTDGSRPVRDAFGHAMRIFDRIRLDDPTGRLADDATLALGISYFRNRKFLLADEYFTDLRRTFPSSEHQFRAHFLGLKAKLESYQGVEYSGVALDEAEKLVRQIQRQFPVEVQQEREYIARAAAEIRFRKAEREWYRGNRHERRSEYGAARMYYATLVNDYGETTFGQQARERLREIGGEPAVPPQRLAWLTELFPEKETVRPLMATQSDTTHR
jgi:TolA-binding protein